METPKQRRHAGSSRTTCSQLVAVTMSELYGPVECKKCTHQLDAGQNIRRVAEAMGHTDIRTTAGYARKECLDMVSPLDKIVPFKKTA